MNLYLRLEDFNADNLAARHAYRSDMAVQDGRCGQCMTRKRDQTRRLCWTCRHSGVSSR